MTSTQYQRIEAEQIDRSEYPDPLMGRTIRDPEGREWVVTETNTKGGESVVADDLNWCYARAATVIE
jgi:hypothetical protein